MSELNKQEFETEREAFMNQLFRTAAHDLNNILSPIIGYPELLMDQFAPDSQECEDLREIQKLANRAISLIKDVQMLIRPDLKVMRECDLNAQIREVLSGGSLSEDAQARIDSVHVTLNLAEGLSSVGSSRPVIQALLNNLLTSMLLLTPDGGSAEVATQDDNGRVALRVTHQVSNLKEDEAARLLEPFFLKKRFSSGLTGLELTVAGELVRQHEGGYTVEYKNGELHHACTLPVFTES